MDLFLANLGDILLRLQFIHLTINNKYHYKFRLRGGGLYFFTLTVILCPKTKNINGLEGGFWFLGKV